jgi:hypothetical protein
VTRSAVEALPFEEPKLSAVAVGHFTGQDFAAQLDRAIQWSAADPPIKLIEAQAVEIADESFAAFLLIKIALGGLCFSWAKV